MKPVELFARRGGSIRWRLGPNRRGNDGRGPGEEGSSGDAAWRWRNGGESTAAGGRLRAAAGRGNARGEISWRLGLVVWSKTLSHILGLPKKIYITKVFCIIYWSKFLGIR
jgi:hypothetical protein